MKYRIIASLLLVAILAGLVVATSDQSAPASAPVVDDSNNLKSFKLP